MKKILITIFLIAFLNSVLEFIFPWWILAVVCALVCYVARQSNIRSFLSGLFGISVSWFILILLKDVPNHHLLSVKMATLFSLHGHYVLFILINIILGGLVGGLSGLCGSMFRQKDSIM